MKTFFSNYCSRARVKLPPYTGTRVMMMPVVMGDLASIPASIVQYMDLLGVLFRLWNFLPGEVGYVTIDEKLVLPGKSLRRPGLHVDGIYKNGAGAWGGGGAPWGQNGLLTVSSHVGCRVWRQNFTGWPNDEGDCEHLRAQCGVSQLLQPGVVYWMSGMCVHESLPMSEAVYRQFVRLSLPSDAPWFEGYTENPMGVKPAGAILPRREFMDA